MKTNMRSDAEIRKQVEDRLKRRLLFVADGGLWLVTMIVLWQVSAYSSFGGFSGVIALIMLAWLGIVGLHFLRTVYVELRDYLVNRAIERERRYYVTRDEYADDTYYEKRKRDSDAAIPRLELNDDGELVDFDFAADRDKSKIERR